MSDAAYILYFILAIVNQKNVILSANVCMHTCIHAARANLYFLCLYTLVQLTR